MKALKTEVKKSQGAEPLEEKIETRVNLMDAVCTQRSSM